MAQTHEIDDDYTSRHTLGLHSFNPQTSEWDKLALPTTTSGVAVPPNMIRVISWNVDYMADYADHRLRCILNHLQNNVVQEAETVPPAILLQEVQDDALPLLLEHSWIRQHFNVSPISIEDWHPYSSYGNVSLIHKSIPVSNVFKIVFEESIMGRFALLADLKIGTPAVVTGVENDAADDSGGGKQDAVLFRLASVHLESLPLGARARPKQLRAVASALKEEACFGGMVCGDMNAIQESDRNTPAEVGLLDAFQGNEGPASNTWGYQPPSRFSPGRLDKILYTPPPTDASTSDGLTSFCVDPPALVGVGLRATAWQASGKKVEVWASDHYGLLTTLSTKRN